MPAKKYLLPSFAIVGALATGGMYLKYIMADTLPRKATVLSVDKCQSCGHFIKAMVETQDGQRWMSNEDIGDVTDHVLVRPTQVGLHYWPNPDMTPNEAKTSVTSFEEELITRYLERFKKEGRLAELVTNLNAEPEVVVNPWP